MNRETLEALVSKSMDETLSPEEQQALERELATCEASRDLAHDLAQMRELANRPAPPCPPRVYASLQERVERTYARRISLFKLAFWTVPRLAMAMSLAVLLFLGWFIGKPFFPNESNSTVATAEYDLIVRDVQQARQLYHRAVGEMERLAETRLLELPPSVAHRYQESLNVINQAIASCELLSDEVPDDHLAYVSLSRAYQAKIELLEKILDT